MFGCNETVNSPLAHQNCTLPSCSKPHGSLLEKDCIDILMRRSVSLLLIPFGSHTPVPTPCLIFKDSFQSQLPCHTHFYASEKGCFQLKKKCGLLGRQGVGWEANGQVNKLQAGDETFYCAADGMVDLINVAC